MPTTILLVDDRPLFRKGLRLLLEEEPDMSVVAEAGDELRESQSPYNLLLILNSGNDTVQLTIHLF